MTGGHLERLLAELGERAEAEIAQVRADAVTRAESIRAACACRAAARKTEAFAALEAEFARRRTSVLAAARRGAQGTLLRAQHALVDRVRDRIRALAIERLAEPASDCGIARRTALLRSYALTPDAVIERVDSGIRLTADRGHLSIDDTIDEWLDANRAAIAIDACRAVEMTSC